jgi:D-alanine-D-alanine ligase
MKPMEIVVLCAGTSTERDVSIVSGTGVCKALRERGHKAILLDVFFGQLMSEPLFPDEYDVDAAADAIRALTPKISETMKTRRGFFGDHVLDICLRADVVFLALHGANGEDGKVQAAFDLFGIPYTGTGHLSSALAMDKTMSKQAFLAHAVPTPKGFSVVAEDLKLAGKTEYPLPEEAGLKWPVIVKPCCGGSSVGVSIARDAQEYQKAMDEVFDLEGEAVIEEFITGREFSVAVIDGEAYPVIEIAPKTGFYDYKNKYSAGSTVETCPADLPSDKTKEMQEIAVKGAAALGITDYCRLDFLMDGDGKLYALEANTLPGMTPTSLIPQEAAVLGISYPELCENLIAISMKKYEK